MAENSRKYFLSLVLWMVAMTWSLWAQDAQPYPTPTQRPVIGVVEFQYGLGQVRNTYLTPLRYDGWATGATYQRWRQWRYRNWMSRQQLSLHLTFGTDAGQHGETWAGRLTYHYAALYQWHPMSRLTLMLGPSLGAGVGFDVNLKMTAGNNPATARVVGDVGAQGVAVWHYLWSRQPCRAMFEVHTPLLGYALQPEYGASYYETFLLQNTHNEHHFTAPHVRQDLDLRLTTHIPVAVVPWLRRRQATLHVGAAWHIETMRLNDVTTRYSQASLLVGWTFGHLPYPSHRAM